jgi:hypothetical protein
MVSKDHPHRAYYILCSASNLDSSLVHGGRVMPGNVLIDPDLIERAFEVSGERTREAAVTKALEEFIALRRQKDLSNLIGKLEWDVSYAHKHERSR